jgi:hypothetical protein
MSRLLRRHRKILASTVLGLWAFAVFVGIANACTWDGVVAVPHQPTMAVHAGGDAINDGMAPGCEEFYSIYSKDLPLVGVVQLLQDMPAGQPLFVATHHKLGVLPISAPFLRLARTAHPSPGVPFFLRIVRLTL